MNTAPKEPRRPLRLMVGLGDAVTKSSKTRGGCGLESWVAFGIELVFMEIAGRSVDHPEHDQTPLKHHPSTTLL